MTEQDYKELHRTRLARDELFRRQYFRLDDESRKIRKMSDSELEDLIAAEASQTHTTHTTKEDK